MTDTAALSTPPLGHDIDSQIHTVKTFNGYAWFSAAHAAASLAIADAQAWESQMPNGATATPSLGVTAPQVGAAAGIFGAAGVWGNLGVSTANLVMGTLKDNTNDETKAASLQITVTNNSSRTVVLYKAKPANADIVNVVPPLVSGESGVFVIARSKGFSTGEGNSKLDLIFRVGGGADYLTKPVTNSTYVEFNFEYVLHESTANVSSPGRWTLTAGIDSSDKHAYGIGMNILQLYGGSFVGNPGSPAFAFYTYSIETGTGQIDIVFYDCAAGAPNAAPVCLITKPTGGRVSGNSVSIEAVIVGSMNDLPNGVNVTVTQVSNRANSQTWTAPVKREVAEYIWDTTTMVNNQPQFPNGWYQLSVSATNASNLTGTSELVYVAVNN